MRRDVNQAAYIVDTLLEQERGCIAVDFDGTLAKHTTWKGPTVLGDPVPAMLQRVKKWVSAGRTVKIFTARASSKAAISAIKAWLKDNDLPDLEVTNEKTRDMIEFWDDRAVEVEKNTGQPAI